MTKLPRTLTATSGALMCIGVNIGAGVFVVPGIMLSLVGSVGMVITLFIVGAISSILATSAYVELGLMNPVSGGDKEYLELAYPYPKKLMSFLLCQVRTWMINPGSAAAVAVAAGKFLLESRYGSKKVAQELGLEFVAGNYDYIARVLSLIMVLVIVVLHARFPRIAIKFQDYMVMLKAALLLFGIVVGIVAVSGGIPNLEMSGALEKPFEGTQFDLNSLGSAFFKVLFVYDGWNTLNYALSEMIEPEKNFPISAFTAVGVSSFLFIGFPIMMFAVVPKEAAMDAGNAFISSQFFTLTLGKVVGSTILPVLVSLSAFSSVMCLIFSASRLTFEAAREGFLPYSPTLSKISQFQSPANAIYLQGCLSFIYIIAPPPGKAYEFLIDLVTYPMAIFYAASVLGCCILRYSRSEIIRPIKSTWVGNITYVFIACILAVVPFLPPKVLDPSIPYFLSPMLGLASMAFFSIYYWRKVVVLDCSSTSYNGIHKGIDAEAKDDSSSVKVDIEYEKEFENVKL